MDKEELREAEIKAAKLRLVEWEAELPRLLEEGRGSQAETIIELIRLWQDKIGRLEEEAANDLYPQLLKEAPDA